MKDLPATVRAACERLARVYSLSADDNRQAKIAKVYGLKPCSGKAVDLLYAGDMGIVARHYVKGLRAEGFLGDKDD